MQKIQMGSTELPETVYRSCAGERNDCRVSRAPKVNAIVDGSKKRMPKVFYGLEFRGAIGDLLDTVEVTHVEGNSWRIKVVIIVTCAQTFIRNREVILESPLTTNDLPNPVIGGTQLTDEQVIVWNTVRYLMMHELNECILFNGVNIEDPLHDLNGITMSPHDSLLDSQRKPV